MQTSNTLRSNLAWENRIRLFFFIGFLLLAGFALFYIKDLLPSVVVAIVFSYLLSPLVNKVESSGLSRLVATSLVFTSFLIFIIAMLSVLTPFLSAQVSSLKGELPKYIDGSVSLIQRLQIDLRQISGGAIDIDLGTGFRGWLESESKELLSNLPAYLQSSASVIILSPFFAFFIIKDGRLMSQKFLSLAPNSVFELTLNLQYQINDQIAQYFRARLLEAVIVGAVVFFGLVIIGFPYAAVLALFAGVTNLIPYLGPVVGAIPAIMIALINSEPSLTILLVVSVYAIAQLIDMIFLIPLVVAKIVDLHPLVVVMAVIVGAQFLGVLGMIISIPICSAAKVTFSSVYQHLTNSG